MRVFKGFPEPTHVSTHVEIYKQNGQLKLTKPGLVPGFCFCGPARGHMSFGLLPAMQRAEVTPRNHLNPHPQTLG